MKSRDFNNDSFARQRLNSAGKSPHEDEDTEPDWLNDCLGSDDLHDQEFDDTTEEE